MANTTCCCNNVTSTRFNSGDLGLPFITEWSAGVGDDIAFTINKVGSYRFIVDWGDGSPPERIIHTVKTLPSSSQIDPSTLLSISHTLIAPPIDAQPRYSVQIYGLFRGWTIATASKPKIIKQTHYGEVGFLLAGAYSDCINFNEFLAGDIGKIPAQAMTNSTGLRSTFKGCTSLVTFDFGEFDYDGGGVLAGNMFQNCSNLVTVDMSNTSAFRPKPFNQAGCTVMFQNCTSLENIDVSDWNMGSTTTIYDMFNNCRSLPFLDVSNWNISNIEGMQRSFFNCRSLNNFDVSSWDTTKIKSFLDCWSACSQLQYLDTSNWNTPNLKELRRTFSGCANLLSSNDHPSGLDLSGWITNKITDMYQCFASCRAITQYDMSLWETPALQNLFGTFAQNDNVTDINIGLNFVTTNVTSMMDTFKLCPLLPSLNIAHWRTPNVTVFGSMFAGCESLVDFDYSEFVLTSVPAWTGGLSNVSMRFFTEASVPSAGPVPNVLSNQTVFSNFLVKQDTAGGYPAAVSMGNSMSYITSIAGTAFNNLTANGWSFLTTSGV